MILNDVPTALHVLCIAPQKLRAYRLAERDGMGLDAAMKRTVESDRGRNAFYRKFWKVDMQDPKLYDLTIDTSRLSFEVAAEVVAMAVKAKTAALAGV